MGLKVVLPRPTLTVFGIQGVSMMPLATIVLNDPEKRQETISEILEILSTNTICILGDTLVFTEKYDAFQVKELSNGN